MARKRNKRYSKQSALDKVVNRSLKGFWMRFDMVDPLGDHDKPINVQVGSTNPVVQLRLTTGPFWSAMRQVLHHKKLKWRIQIEMEFKRKDGSSEMKPRELVAYGALPNLDDEYQSVVEDMFRDAEEKNYLDKYVRTYIVQEVLSGQEIKDEDFTE